MPRAGLVPGPKAVALRKIVLVLARQGRIAEAWSFEAELEERGGHASEVALVRDTALLAIADAQRVAGDPQEARATVLRVSVRNRTALLEKLAAIPPRP